MPLLAVTPLCTPTWKRCHLVGRGGGRHREAKKLGLGHKARGRGSQAHHTLPTKPTMLDAKGTSTSLASSPGIGVLRQWLDVCSHTEHKSDFTHQKNKVPGLWCVLISPRWAALPTSSAPWPHSHPTIKGGTFWYQGLFSSQSFYYKRKAYATPTF